MSNHDDADIVFSNNRLEGSAVSIGTNATASVTNGPAVDIAALRRVIDEAEGQLEGLPYTRELATAAQVLSAARMDLDRGEVATGTTRLRGLLGSAAASVLGSATVDSLRRAVGGR